MNHDGGLAEITTIQTEDGRRTIRVGNTRLLDIIGDGPNMILECKGSKRDPVRADPQDLLRKLSTMLAG